ncbi:uncharacterized protein BJ171DRAFT_509739 [Polychytrium aggregatum]|uniref:uncharacterized protein n=1 Tax=Polychytrium aggregatum TaxID=110093 RepID=UPI0022FDD655|nr:uncharacterized protein BJ171DRAFT_509739 [Polychytrium aggregatum]KAI9203482.1 hypothetical protein BJ171DRAFT_509739 [Polychytrium aggregatum]
MGVLGALCIALAAAQVASTQPIVPDTAPVAGENGLISSVSPTLIVLVGCVAAAALVGLMILGWKRKPSNGQSEPSSPPAQQRPAGTPLSPRDDAVARELEHITIHRRQMLSQKNPKPPVFPNDSQGFDIITPSSHSEPLKATFIKSPGTSPRSSVSINISTPHGSAPSTPVLNPLTLSAPSLQVSLSSSPRARLSMLYSPSLPLVTLPGPSVGSYESQVLDDLEWMEDGLPRMKASSLFVDSASLTLRSALSDASSTPSYSSHSTSTDCSDSHALVVDKSPYPLPLPMNRVRSATTISVPTEIADIPHRPRSHSQSNERYLAASKDLDHTGKILERHRLKRQSVRIGLPAHQHPPPATFEFEYSPRTPPPFTRNPLPKLPE